MAGLAGRSGDMVARLLAREWLGLAVGGGCLLAALLLHGSWWWVPLAGVGLALVIGSGVHLLALRRAVRRHPAPGRLVSVTGCRVHVLAEGEAGAMMPIVLFGGGHAAGATIDHLHRALRTVTRSILIDRPGTGWSDTGPFPRSTAREAEEIVATLAAAGERGPFVFVGYSFGGLLVANIARRHPALVARLVLLDPTPLETLVFGPRLGAIGAMRRDALGSALLRLVGLHTSLEQRRVARNPAHAASGLAFRTALGAAIDTLRAVEISAGGQLASWSIYRELQGPHIASVGWETSVYDGDLGDMDVWLVAPGTSDEVGATPEVAAASGGDAARMFRFYQRTRERYLAASSRSRRIVAPPGSTHQFVYEHPDFVIDVLREAVRPGGAA